MMDFKFILLLITCNIKIGLNLNENGCNEDVERGESQRHICFSSGSNYGQSCHYGYPIIRKTVTCIHVEMDDLQQYINSWSIDTDNYYYPVTFNMIESNISTWPTSVFVNKQKLFALHLRDIKLQKIMPGAFNYLDSLKELYLNENELTTISDGIFNSLTQLEKLDLSSNKIQNITNHAFVGGKLQNLLLNNNNISQIGQELVDSLTYLQILNISNNNLREVRNFSNLQLHKLSMSYNELSTVDFELLQSVQEEIDLSYNNISELVNYDLLTATKLRIRNNNIRGLEKNENVIQLDITHNKLEEIESNVFGSSLNLLYLGKNFISIINLDAFFGLRNLEYLTLDNNNLSSLPNSCFRDLISLKLLDLSGNKFTHFTYGTFDNLVALNTLNISGNQLINLQLSIFHSLGMLQNLNFANNEISDVNVDDLLHMKFLRTVDLTGNIWSCNKLVNIIRSLKLKHVNFHNGDFWEESNIHGIKCHETSDISTAEQKSDANLDDSKLNRFYNEDFTKTVMYKYFNKDFKDSNFFKYLESLKNSFNDTNIQNFNAKYLQALINEIKSTPNNDTYNNNFANITAVYNYFNKDFKKSGFFKYLESFKNQEIKQNCSEKLVGSQLNEIINILNNMTKNKSTDLLSNKNSNMYNYFDKDFRNSSFFKYLENFNAHVHVEKQSVDVNDSKMEKLISTLEGQKPTGSSVNYTGLLSFIVILLAIILCVQIGTAYINTIQTKKLRLSKKEDVELI